VLNATFNNISVISWQTALLVEAIPKSNKKIAERGKIDPTNTQTHDRSLSEKFQNQISKS
jgi:hypothetical protein